LKVQSSKRSGLGTAFVQSFYDAGRWYRDKVLANDIVAKWSQPDAGQKIGLKLTLLPSAKRSLAWGSSEKSKYDMSLLRA